MSDIVFFIEILVCLGTVSGAILLSDRLRKVYELPFLNSQFFYIVLIAFFAFIDIWGLVFLNRITADFNLLPEYRQKITAFVSLLGFPFLVIGWYMFIRFSLLVCKREVEMIVNFTYFSLLIFIFFIISFFLEDISSFLLFYKISGINLILYVFLVIDIMIHSFGILNVFIYSKKIEVKSIRICWTQYASIQMALQFIKLTMILLIFKLPILSHFIIVLYFMSISLPVLWVYQKMETMIASGFYLQFSELSEDSLFIKNGVTRREREIIDGICDGLTNQEIADRLFITLQTVKDHTHRIYLKMDVKNRMQLINLVNAHKPKEAQN